MAKDESTVQRDNQLLQEVFVSVTGETSFTERQSEQSNKKVINLAESDSTPTEQQLDTDPVANGLKDAIGDPKPK